MTHELPLVTVIAVCYNHERFVIECLESIRTQTYPNIQLIIMDDCSKDQSVEIVANWIETNRFECDFVCHNANQGLCKTLNEALLRAEGKYVSIIAADDAMNPQKIEKQVSIMEQSYAIGVVYSQVEKITEHGDLIGISQGYEWGNGMLKQLCVYNPIYAASTLIRRECYEKVGEYNESYIFEDHDMWLRIAEHYEFRFSSYVSVKYRSVESSIVHARRDELLRNTVEILLTHYIKRPQLRRWLGVTLTKHAGIMYRYDMKFQKSFLWKSVFATFSIRSLAMATFASLGLRYEMYNRVKNGLFGATRNSAEV